jgi:hypothetical protein
MPPRRIALLSLAAAAAVFVAYSNHFHNSFHFDDAHAIQNNVYLRSLRNIPLFFKDASTFSSIPTNATYRPVTSVTFAFDYWREGALDPFPFHVTQWVLHLILGLLVYFFLDRILSICGLGSEGQLLSLFGATLFCLHRVNTETVNYLSSRSEILAGLGVVGSFVCYQYLPRWRKSFVWLLPAVVGAFAKQSAIIFAPLFALYLLIFPDEYDPAGASGALKPGRRWFLYAVPPFVFAFLFYVLQARLGSPQLLYSLVPPLVYFQTQTFAWLHYARLFLLPLGLSADSDWGPIPLWYDTRVFAGVVFAALLTAAGLLFARRRPAGRGFLFGVLWYFVSLAPSSSLFPLSEMVNEHRPYLPYIGLVLALVSCVGDLLSAGWRGRALSRLARRGLGVAAVVVLVAQGAGTFTRNRVWASEETLWKGVTEASPGNARGWMNYGLIFMARGDYPLARTCFERARALAPNYDILEINLGILDGAQGNSAGAEQHFARAISLNSHVGMAHYYYGRWLHENRRDREAAEHLRMAIASSPADFEARALLLRVYSTLQDEAHYCQTAREMLAIAPGDRDATAAVARCAGK